MASWKVAFGDTDLTPLSADRRFPTVRPKSGWVSSSGLESADASSALAKWTVCPEDERIDPELTVPKRAEVDLCWGMGGEAYFAALHRLADGTWDAWLTPSHVPVTGREEPTELLTPAGVSYEMARAAVFRTMGDDMPTGFGLNYLNTRITPGLPGPAQV